MIEKILPENTCMHRQLLPAAHLRSNGYSPLFKVIFMWRDHGSCILFLKFIKWWSQNYKYIVCMIESPSNFPNYVTAIIALLLAYRLLWKKYFWMQKLGGKLICGFNFFM